VTQEDAGLDVIVPDEVACYKDERTLFNQAVTVSVTRRLATRGMSIDLPDAPTEVIPAISDRIVLGGKLDNYSGFLPGIFENLCRHWSWVVHLYPGRVWRGAEVLAEILTDKGSGRPEKLTEAWILQQNPSVEKLLESARDFTVPNGVRLTSEALDALYGFVVKARQDLAGTLNTGLTDPETCELMLTRDVKEAVRLTLKGLAKRHQITIPPA